LRALARSRLPRQDAVFISHHASVSDSVLEFLGGIPHIVHFHGPWAEEAKVEGKPFWRTWYQHRSERRVYRSASQIITLSEAFRKIVIETYCVEPERVTVVPGGIDSAAFDPGVSREEARKHLGWPTDRPIILSVRRLIRRVGLDCLLDAVRIICRRHRDVLVMIAGRGPMNGELAKMISEYGLADNVKLLGYVPDIDLPFAYAAADLTVVPTQSLEGFGMVLLESLFGGTLPLVTPVGGLPEVCYRWAPESIFQDRTSAAMADRISRYLSGELKPPAPDECRRFVRATYDWQIIAKRVSERYQI
jgi:glycosyltransferase involved in cell wall biosynthesis